MLRERGWRFGVGASGRGRRVVGGIVVGDLLCAIGVWTEGCRCLIDFVDGISERGWCIE
jgi:hypothetical protein